VVDSANFLTEMVRTQQIPHSCVRSDYAQGDAAGCQVSMELVEHRGAGHQPTLERPNDRECEGMIR
jgi:hypothetical protein